MKATAFKNKLYGQSSDRRVEQIGNVLTNADYEILLSGTSDDDYYIGETRKTASLTYNPSTKKLKIDGADIAMSATTLAGYGITDAKIVNGTITLGSNSITPLTSHQDISGKVNKSGDTMSGSLTVNGNLQANNHNLWAVQSDSATEVQAGVKNTGTNGSNLYLFSRANRAGLYSSYGATIIGIDNNKKVDINGTTYSIANAANFRSALGLGSTALSSLSWDEGLQVVATLGGGIDTIGHSNSITAGTIGSSSATSGSTIAIPYANYDKNGHITSKGTHTHTVTGFIPTSALSTLYTISVSSITITTKKQLNAHSGETIKNMTNTNLAVSTPSGYTFVRNTLIEATGFPGLFAIFDGASNYTLTTGINGYLYNASNSNLNNNSTVVTIRIYSLFRKTSV